MFYQLKITRKGTKPPVWRRCTVAADVTFANMAAMLEKLVQYPAGSLYEIEFFQKKVQIRENGDGEVKNNFTLLNAGETETAELMDSEKWFTFRQYGADKEAPEYRVDIEKKDEGTAEAPSIVKEVKRFSKYFISVFIFRNKSTRVFISSLHSIQINLLIIFKF